MDNPEPDSHHRKIDFPTHKGTSRDLSIIIIPMNGPRTPKPACPSNCLEHLGVAHHLINNADGPCNRAGTNGHLDCLRFAHESGSHWDESTCIWIAYAGHVDCLRYAHENGCPWDKMTILVASENGRVACLAYALENGCPTDFNDWDVYEYGIRKDGRDSVIAYWYHSRFRFPYSMEDFADDFAKHRRRHIQRARTLLRCAVTLLGLHRRATERVYAPGGVGYQMAKTSFHGLVAETDGVPSLED